MSTNELGHLIKMANQIASNIGIGASEDDAVERVVNHIGSFWSRPMREKVCASIEASSDELSPTATRALLEIRAQL